LLSLFLVLLDLLLDLLKPLLDVLYGSVCSRFEPLGVSLPLQAVVSQHSVDVLDLAVVGVEEGDRLEIGAGPFLRVLIRVA